MKDDHGSYHATFAVAKRKPEKKFRLVRDSLPRPLRYRCSLIGRGCTSVAEVKGSNPAQAGFFFRLSFPNCKSCKLR